MTVYQQQTTKTAGGVFLSCGQKNYLVTELCARADNNSDQKKETTDISRTKRYLNQPCPDKKVNSFLISPKVEENDQNKIVLCHYCMKCEHLSCKKVYGVAAEKLRAKKYFCSLDCAKLSSHTSSGMEKQIMDEIGKVLAEVRGNSAELRKVQDTIGELQRTHNSFAEKVDTLLNEMQAIKEDQQLLKNDVAVLQEEQFAVNETITDLEKQLDQLNRAALATHAVILGVPSSKDEDLKKVITDIALAVKCTLPEDAIVETKRLVSKDGEQTGKPVPIKVIFPTQATRKNSSPRRNATVYSFHQQSAPTTLAQEAAESFFVTN
ncbi:conserved hypothetical protein [Culex quinquefasciatus]|uniref:Uncharacterized protein n=1 Tax=Culex quinquefasciatus TaxID=7176 RepID=B0XE33_CULQU|nr:conserved hypothetical protein [Culex quinquefasciatus]|eukprot:XP_001867905.1 conserved hypothetical protein [Culex quinquefasciatus]